MSEQLETNQEQPQATPEPAPEAAPAPTPAPDPAPAANSSLQELLRREAELRQRADQLKEQQRAVEQAKELQRLAKEDLPEFLRRSGMTPEQVQEALAQKQPDPFSPVNSSIEELRTKVARFEQEREEQRQQAVWQEQETKLQKWLDSNKSTFPLSAKAGMHGQIANIQRAYYQQTGQFLSEEAAARETEQYLSKLKESLLDSQASSDPEPPSLSNQSTPSVGNRTDPTQAAMSNEEWLQHNLDKLLRS